MFKMLLGNYNNHLGIRPRTTQEAPLVPACRDHLWRMCPKLLLIQMKVEVQSDLVSCLSLCQCPCSLHFRQTERMAMSIYLKLTSELLSES